MTQEEPTDPPPAPRTIRARFDGFLKAVRARVPPGLRLVLGIVLMIGGVLGFLPVLGFWMIPLGAAVAALDIRLLRRWWRRRRR